ncbi:hypothetical protein [Streptomyces sp. NPDC048659]|uniref:hypothetical protein n=1 Tax=Streptomyces sp. NPDC048659 TaxID=3155489 RepID=UPI00343810CE
MPDTPDSPVRYVRVRVEGVPFAPATRAYGNVAVVGVANLPASDPPDDFLQPNVPRLYTDVNEARRTAAGPLGEAIATALVQQPGPSEVWGVRMAQPSSYDDALAKVGTLNVQLVVVADTELALTAPAGGPPVPSPGIVKLAQHVSGPAADGMERMGVAMLAKGASDPAVVTGSLATERMVYVAHKSDEDVAAAVAGTIAGYPPHISLLLKQVKVSSAPFSAEEIIRLNGSEGPGTRGPQGKGVNWLVDPPLIPGSGVYLGEGYTGLPATKKYIDIVRTVDDVTFRLKARLIGTIGNLRISRSGLRGLVAEMETVLEPLRRSEVIEGYEIVVPLLALLDKPQRTPAEDDLVRAAQTERAAEAMVRVDYAGAVHRIDVSLMFD